MGASINGHVVHVISILWLIGSCLKRLKFSTVFDCDKDVVAWDFKDLVLFYLCHVHISRFGWDFGCDTTTGC